MRRLLVALAVLAALIMAVALPAAAQSTPVTGDGVTLESLATVAGASAAAAIVVAFAGAIITLSARAKRVLSAVVGLVVVVAVTLATADVTLAVFIMAVLNGMIAGLAASKGVEVGTQGLSHTVTN